MELFRSGIRRGYAAGETIQGSSKKHGVHRRMVRQAIGNAIPPERKSGCKGSSPTRSCQGTDRPYAGRGSSGAAQAASYGSSDLDAPVPLEHADHPVRRSDSYGVMCGSGSESWGLADGKCSCRRAKSWARKLRWRSAWRRMVSSRAAKCAGCSSALCAAWAVAMPSIEPIPTPRNKLCLRPTSMRSTTLGQAKTLRYDNMTSVVREDSARIPSV